MAIELQMAAALFCVEANSHAKNFHIEGGGKGGGGGRDFFAANA